MKARPKPPVQQGTFLYPDLIDQLDPKDQFLVAKIAPITMNRLKSKAKTIF